MGKRQTKTHPRRPLHRLVGPPIRIDHDSSAGYAALDEVEALLNNNPKARAAFKKRFRRFQDLLIYKRVSALRANRCTAGFQPTRKLTEFLAALRAEKTELNPVEQCLRR